MRVRIGRRFEDEIEARFETTFDSPPDHHAIEGIRMRKVNTDIEIV